METKGRKRSPSRPPRQRVAWSTSERRQIVDRAVEIHAERPDLAGLPLLRAAMQSLPPERRRTVVALSQAAWFEADLKAAIQIKSERQSVPVATTPTYPEGDPYIPLFERHTVQLTEVADEIRRVHAVNISIAETLKAIQEYLQSVYGVRSGKL